MNQVATRSAGRIATHDPGVVERFKQEIVGQKRKLFPDAFHREFEILEASVARYEKLCAGLPDVEAQWEKLKERMSEDPAIAPYLYAADGHPQHAVNLAKADIEYWKCLKSSGWTTVAQRKSAIVWRLAKIAIVPLVIVLLTALLGNLVASSIQNRAFQRQKFFEAKFQRLREGQQRSVTLVARLRSLKGLMAGWERFGGGISPRQMLGEYREEIEQIRALGLDNEGGGQVSSVAQMAQQDLDSYISCLEGKVGSERNNASTSSCSEEFELTEFEALALSFVKEIGALAA